MRCPEVRELAEAVASEQLPSEVAQEISDHLTRCASCRDEVEGLTRLRASVRAAYLGSSALAPEPAFRAALSERLRLSVPGRKSEAFRQRRWLTLAASLMLFVAGGLGLRMMGISGFSEILHAAVGDHRFCAVSFTLAERPITLIEAAERHDDPVSRQLETVQLGPVQLSGGTMRVLERHSCVYEGRRFAHIVLRYKRQLVSIVVTRDGRLLRNVPGASAARDGSLSPIASVEGQQVAAFSGPDHLAFVISTLSQEDVREVARSVLPPVSRALALAAPAAAR